jgi:hypothetical protein
MITPLKHERFPKVPRRVSHLWALALIALMLGAYFGLIYWAFSHGPGPP